MLCNVWSLLDIKLGRHFCVDPIGRHQELAPQAEQTAVVEGKIEGRLRPTGIRPKFVEKFEVAGIHLPPNVFGAPF